MVVLEAMAGRCPAVAIRASGIDDVIINGYNGYKTKSDIAAWAKKVIYLMENPEKLEKMSQNAYDFSRKFSIESVAERSLKVYSKAIQTPKNFNMKNM